MEATLVHVCRHGQVDNPDHVLYGRAEGYRLSELGDRMAERLGEYFADVDVQHLRASPLQRAQETMAPIARRHPDIEVVTDYRLIEAANALEGQTFGRFNQRLLLPKHWWHFRNPRRPSWGEPHTSIAQRMRPAILDAAASVPQGGHAVVVSHQLPIWIARLAAEGRGFLHSPASRECRLASVTTFSVLEGRIVKVEYDEPCADLYPKPKLIIRPGV